MTFEKLTESEKMIMKCIWMREEHMSLPDIVVLANENYGKDWKPQTVSTFLAHLVKKGFLNLYRQGRIYKYQPLVKEEEYSSSLLKEHIRFWNNNSMKSFAMNLCDDKTISKEDLQSLKNILDELK